MSLPFVKPPKTATMNVLLYGPGKVGKTLGACSAPGPVLLVNADRGNASRLAHDRRGDDLHETPMVGLQTFTDVILHFRDGSAPEKTVVLDPVGDARRILIEEMSNRALRPPIQLQGDANIHIERFCRALCELPVNVVIVAHELATKDEEAGTFERVPYTGTKNPALGNQLIQMVDVIGYCGVVESEDGGDPRYMAQLIAGNGRKGGDRFDVLGKARELDLTEWSNLINQTGGSK